MPRKLQNHPNLLKDIYMKNVSSEMENKPLSINEFKGAFFSLKINKSTGHDDISYNVLSKCFGELCTLLKHILD